MAHDEETQERRAKADRLLDEIEGASPGRPRMLSGDGSVRVGAGGPGELFERAERIEIAENPLEAAP